jgi:hypothetical protein
MYVTFDETSYRRKERADDLATWHEMLLDRFTGTPEDEPLDRLTASPPPTGRCPPQRPVRQAGRARMRMPGCVTCFPSGGPKVPESFGQAALEQHSPAFSGLSDRCPDGTRAVSLSGGNRRMGVAKSNRRKRQDRDKAAAKLLLVTIRRTPRCGRSRRTRRRRGTGGAGVGVGSGRAVRDLAGGRAGDGCRACGAPSWFLVCADTRSSRRRR